MARNPVGFEVTDPVAGWNEADFDDIFIRKDCLLEGGLWGWGYNQYGTMGTNTSGPSGARSSPVQTISGGTNWRNLGDKGAFTVSAVKSDGTLWLWGFGGGGVLGNGLATSRSSPVQTVSGGTDWKCATTGTFYSAGIKNDGSLWTWGNNVNGGLGNNNRIARSSPVQTVSAGTNWKGISTYNNNMIAIKTDGTLWTWGPNVNGILGVAGSAGRSSPIQTVSAGTNWKQASAGYSTMGAVKTDGSLWLWGAGVNGLLGNNSPTNRSSPVQTVSDVNTWKQISVSCFHVGAIKTDGSLWLWGLGGSGVFGNNSELDVSSPIQTVSGGTNWRCVAVSYNHTAGIKTDGTLWLWGFNSSDGRLGDNTLIDRSSPVQTISGGTSWRNIQMNSVSTMAIREDCW